MPPDFVKTLNEASVGHFPSHMGIAITSATKGRVCSKLEIEPHHMAPNGYLHAATVVAIADTSAGYGVMVSLPPGAYSFTTVELKTNFLGTARSGSIECEAIILHEGRTTQVWDATVKASETGRIIAAFRCTQFLLYKK